MRLPFRDLRRFDDTYGSSVFVDSFGRHVPAGANALQAMPPDRPPGQQPPPEECGHSRYLLLLRLASVRGVEVVERTHGFREQSVVATRFFFCSAQHGFETFRVRNRDAADVEKMNRST